MMHEMDLHHNSHQQSRLVTDIFSKGIEENALYTVPYFPESHFERNDPRCPYLFDVDWKDQSFITELKKRICPALFLAFIRIAN